MIKRDDLRVTLEVNKNGYRNMQGRNMLSTVVGAMDQCVVYKDYTEWSGLNPSIMLLSGIYVLCYACLYILRIAICAGRRRVGSLCEVHM